MAHWTHFEKEQEKDVKKLISCLSHLQDESDNNFQLALQYAWSNFRFHRYLDVSSHQIDRTLDGIYEKFVIHSDLSKAESWKRLTEEFLDLPLPNTEGTKTDAHYAVLSLLLCLSDSPSKNDYVEKPRQKQTEEKEPFDWGKYLREGEDFGLSPDEVTPEWSDMSEEDEETLSREDSGIQVDRTPQDDADKKSAPPVVSWKVGEPDARTWLEQHVVHQYWTSRTSRFSNSIHLHSNLAAVWDQHLYTTDPLYTPDEKTFVTETQVIRETLWLLSGVKKLFIFQLSDGKVTVRNDIVVSHVTHVSLLFFLWVETVRPYLEIVDKWIVHGHLFDPAKEFIIQRNKDVPVNHRDFWYATYTLYSISEKTAENEDKMSDNASASSGSDQAPASRQHTMVSFLRPVLKQIIMAGKSMQLLKNLKCKSIQQQDSSRDADRKSLYTLFLESVQSRLQHGKESVPDSATEQQVNKQSLIKMQSIVARHLELNDVHDPLLAINFARLYLDQSDFLEMFTCEDISVDRSSESVTCQSFELTLRSCLYPHIDKQYLKCCGNLMQTLKEDYKLIEYLKSMRNFFLLEAGDTMYDFYTSIFDKIREKELWQNVVFLNVQLQEAVSQRYPEDSARLSICFENVDLAKKKLPVHTLDGLVLSYKVPWPVDIVISSECQKIYNQIFLLLLLIKWAKYSLDVLQFNDMDSLAKKESPNEDLGSEPQMLPHLLQQDEPKNQQIHRMFILRVKLMHFVNSLHNYIMTRILHSTGLEFQHQVEEAKDLDQLIKIHYRYLSTIHDRCLLREKVSSVKEAIMKVMNVVLMFADRWHAGLGAWKVESIVKMESDFTNCHKFLVKVLNKAVCRGSFPHLESLALSLMAGMEQG
ncbi:gamma-tubulin complex component 5 isoform X3 [Hyperolius riggenbachi]|uniref:gamma-tubulin complex component 5 isoform X3 n=1 Tax=Hyperolius riggenbachi TaxID=752182 RepID=UPI0035A301C2